MTLRRALLPLLLLLPSAVSAETAPKGDNVVVLTVSDVQIPGRLPGECRLSGAVREVRKGHAFRPGQEISLALPCGGAPSVQPLTPVASQTMDPAVLRRSKLGIVRLDDAGRVIWKPPAQLLGRPGREPRDPWMRVWGYQVLDGATLPLQA